MKKTIIITILALSSVGAIANESIVQEYQERSSNLNMKKRLQSEMAQAIKQAQLEEQRKRIEEYNSLIQKAKSGNIEPVMVDGRPKTNWDDFK